MTTKFGQLIIEGLRDGNVGVLPTDTLYGIVGSALKKDAILRIYTVRRRNPKKAVIVLVSSINDLRQFGVALTPKMKKILNKVWPGQVSVIVPITQASARKKFAYLHRGTDAIAFRMPKPVWLREIIKKTGPLAAPSANVEGKSPALTIAAAKKYFGDRIDFYVDMGRRVSKPSTIIKIENEKMTLIRHGAVRVPTA